MDGSKKAGLAEQVRRFRARFVQSAGAALGKVVTGHVLKLTVMEEAGLFLPALLHKNESVQKKGAAL